MASDPESQTHQAEGMACFLGSQSKTLVVRVCVCWKRFYKESPPWHAPTTLQPTSKPNTPPWMLVLRLFNIIRPQ